MVEVKPHRFINKQTKLDLSTTIGYQNWIKNVKHLPQANFSNRVLKKNPNRPLRLSPSAIHNCYLDGEGQRVNSRSALRLRSSLRLIHRPSSSAFKTMLQDGVVFIPCFQITTFNWQQKMLPVCKKNTYLSAKNVGYCNKNVTFLVKKMSPIWKQKMLVICNKNFAYLVTKILPIWQQKMLRFFIKKCCLFSNILASAW